MSAIFKPFSSRSPARVTYKQYEIKFTLAQPSPWPKKCNACGREIKSLKSWLRLPRVGVQGSGDPESPDLELRNCPCGSTLAVSVWLDG